MLPRLLDVENVRTRVQVVSPKGATLGEPDEPRYDEAR
jgi:hypothetical protein